MSFVLYLWIHALIFGIEYFRYFMYSCTRVAVPQLWTTLYWHSVPLPKFMHSEVRPQQGHVGGCAEGFCLFQGTGGAGCAPVAAQLSQHLLLSRNLPSMHRFHTKDCLPSPFRRIWVSQLVLQSWFRRAESPRNSKCSNTFCSENSCETTASSGIKTNHKVLLTS